MKMEALPVHVLSHAIVLDEAIEVLLLVVANFPVRIWVHDRHFHRHDAGVSMAFARRKLISGIIRSQADR